MTVKATIQMAKEFYETIVDVLERQSTAQPCIYRYNGKIYVSRGDTLAGKAQLVYDELATIILNSDELKQYLQEHDEDTVINLIADELDYHLND